MRGLQVRGMPKRSVEERLAEAERKLAEAERRSKRLESYKARLRRSIAGLRRWVGKTKPPVEKPARPAAGLAMLETSTEADRLESIRSTIQRWGDHFAKVLGVAKPRVLFRGEKGACHRVARAHIHLETTWWNQHGERTGRGRAGNVAHRRGTICVNRSHYLDADEERLRELAAHEVSHLRRSSKHPGRGHGKRMSAIVDTLIDNDGLPTPAQTEAEERTEEG